jgi:hypothetical protein
MGLELLFRRRNCTSSGKREFCPFVNDLALPYAKNSQLQMIHITSFNEWHEDTQIEPSVVTGPTTTDTSATGSQYTQGLVYQGYGTTYLDILRNVIDVFMPLELASSEKQTPKLLKTQRSQS